MLFLLVALVVGVLAGPIDLGIGAIVESAAARLHVPGFETSLSPTEEAILWEIRVPRVVLAALVGGTLALAGATYQGVFRNPLADPYLLGVAAGAGLGATIAIAYLPSSLQGQRALPVAAFVGGAIAVFLTYAVGRSARRERDAATLVLAGVTVTAFFTAWQTFVQQQNAETLQQVYSWILGNIPSTGWSDVVLVLPYIAVATVVILALRRVVDVLNLGDDEAASLGVDVRRVRLALVVAATLGTAAAVAVTGLIGFVGIIVPHTVRLLSGVGYRALLPLSFVVGAGFLVLADVDRAHRAFAGRDPTRRRDRVLRRTLLRTRPAHDALGGVMPAALDLVDVTIRLGGKAVVDRVSGTVERGEWLALIGPNGAGKTTLLRAVARLVPFEGRISIEGRSVADLRRAAALAGGRGRAPGTVYPAVDDGGRIRSPRPYAASGTAGEGGAARPGRRRRRAFAS